MLQPGLTHCSHPTALLASRQAGCLGWACTRAELATHPLARSELYESVPPPKKRYGIGTSTYMTPVSIGHQLCHSTQP